MRTEEYEGFNKNRYAHYYTNFASNRKRTLPNMGRTTRQGGFKKTQFPKSISPFKRIRNR